MTTEKIFEDTDSINTELNHAIERVIKEWCMDCVHRHPEMDHCDFEEFKHHCAIANLIYVLRAGRY